MDLLITFLISMVPVIELRGAIPIGMAAGVEPWVACVLSVLGNLLPVPFILLFIRKIFAWMRRFDRLRPIVEALERKADGKSDKVKKYELLGLFLFVAVPLPGTGAWTGSLIAALMEIRLKRAIPAIALGVITAGIAVTLVAVLGVEALSFFLGYWLPIITAPSAYWKSKPIRESCGAYAWCRRRGRQPPTKSPTR